MQWAQRQTKSHHAHMKGAYSGHMAMKATGYTYVAHYLTADVALTKYV